MPQKMLVDGWDGEEVFISDIWARKTLFIFWKLSWNWKESHLNSRLSVLNYADSTQTSTLGGICQVNPTILMFSCKKWKWSQCCHAQLEPPPTACPWVRCKFIWDLCLIQKHDMSTLQSADMQRRESWWEVKTINGAFGIKSQTVVHIIANELCTLPSLVLHAHAALRSFSAKRSCKFSF